MANFKKWWIWFRSQPFSFKWVLWLILLRPIIDLFWAVKETSLVSPLQIAGLLTFSLALIYGLSINSKGSKQPWSLLIFAVLLIFNLVLLIGESSSIKTVIHVMRITSPVILLFYMMKVVVTQERFHGLMFTYLISSVLPLSLLAYEIVFEPISYHELPDSRGGGYRLSGPYADIFNYLAYLVGDFIILAYLSVRYLAIHNKPIGFGRIVIACLFFVIGVHGLQHQATWAVLFMLLGLTAYYSSGNKRMKGYIVALLIPVVISGPVLLAPRFQRLFSKEIGAYTGQGSEKKILNGRLIRWEAYFDIWSDTGVIPKLIGVGIADFDPMKKKAMTGGGMHSDYVRFLFGSGLIGLMALLSFYLRAFLNRKRYEKPEQFFITSSLAVLLMYSISSNPIGGSGSLIFIFGGAFAISMQRSKSFYAPQKVIPSPSLK